MKNKNPVPEKKNISDEIFQDEPLYNVILYNDDVNYYFDVVRAVQSAIKCSAEVAEHITHIAHTQGRAIVTTAPLDFAEQAYSVLISWKLSAEIQKV